MKQITTVHSQGIVYAKQDFQDRDVINVQKDIIITQTAPRVHVI